MSADLQLRLRSGLIAVNPRGKPYDGSSPFNFRRFGFVEAVLTFETKKPGELLVPVASDRAPAEADKVSEFKITFAIGDVKSVEVRWFRRPGSGAESRIFRWTASLAGPPTTILSLGIAPFKDNARATDNQSFFRVVRGGLAVVELHAQQNGDFDGSDAERLWPNFDWRSLAGFLLADEGTFGIGDLPSVALPGRQEAEGDIRVALRLPDERADIVTADGPTWRTFTDVFDELDRRALWPKYVGNAGAVLREERRWTYLPGLTRRHPTLAGYVLDADDYLSRLAVATVARWRRVSDAALGLSSLTFSPAAGARIEVFARDAGSSRLLDTIRSHQTDWPLGWRQIDLIGFDLGAQCGLLTKDGATLGYEPTLLLLTLREDAVAPKSKTYVWWRARYALDVRTAWPVPSQPTKPEDRRFFRAITTAWERWRLTDNRIDGRNVRHKALLAEWDVPTAPIGRRPPAGERVWRTRTIDGKTLPVFHDTPHRRWIRTANGWLGLDAPEAPVAGAPDTSRSTALKGTLDLIGMAGLPFRRDQRMAIQIEAKTETELSLGFDDPYLERQLESEGTPSYWTKTKDALKHLADWRKCMADRASLGFGLGTASSPDGHGKPADPVTIVDTAPIWYRAPLDAAGDPLPARDEPPRLVQLRTNGESSEVAVDAMVRALDDTLRTARLVSVEDAVPRDYVADQQRLGIFRDRLPISYQLEFRWQHPDKPIPDMVMALRLDSRAPWPERPSVVLWRRWTGYGLFGLEPYTIEGGRRGHLDTDRALIPIQLSPTTTASPAVLRLAGRADQCPTFDGDSVILDPATSPAPVGGWNLQPAWKGRVYVLPAISGVGARPGAVKTWFYMHPAPLLALAQAAASEASEKSGRSGKPDDDLQANGTLGVPVDLVEGIDNLAFAFEAEKQEPQSVTGRGLLPRRPTIGDKVPVKVVSARFKGHAAPTLDTSIEGLGSVHFSSTENAAGLGSDAPAAYISGIQPYELELSGTGEPERRIVNGSHPLIAYRGDALLTLDSLGTICGEPRNGVTEMFVVQAADGASAERRAFNFVAFAVPAIRAYVDGQPVSVAGAGLAIAVSGVIADNDHKPVGRDSGSTHWSLFGLEAGNGPLEDRLRPAELAGFALRPIELLYVSELEVHVRVALAPGGVIETSAERSGGTLTLTFTKSNDRWTVALVAEELITWEFPNVSEARAAIPVLTFRAFMDGRMIAVELKSIAVEADGLLVHLKHAFTRQQCWLDPQAGSLELDVETGPDSNLNPALPVGQLRAALRALRGKPTEIRLVARLTLKFAALDVVIRPAIVGPQSSVAWDVSLHSGGVSLDPVPVVGRSGPDGAFTATGTASLTRIPAARLGFEHGEAVAVLSLVSEHAKDGTTTIHAAALATLRLFDRKDGAPGRHLLCEIDIPSSRTSQPPVLRVTGQLLIRNDIAVSVVDAGESRVAEHVALCYLDTDLLPLEVLFAGTMTAEPIRLGVVMDHSVTYADKNEQVRVAHWRAPQEIVFCRASALAKPKRDAFVTADQRLAIDASAVFWLPGLGDRRVPSMGEPGKSAPVAAVGPGFFLDIGARDSLESVVGRLGRVVRAPLVAFPWVPPKAAPKLSFRADAPPSGWIQMPAQTILAIGEGARASQPRQEAASLVLRTSELGLLDARAIQQVIADPRPAFGSPDAAILRYEPEFGAPGNSVWCPAGGDIPDLAGLFEPTLPAHGPRRAAVLARPEFDARNRILGGGHVVDFPYPLRLGAHMDRLTLNYQLVVPSQVSTAPLQQAGAQERIPAFVVLTTLSGDAESQRTTGRAKALAPPVESWAQAWLRRLELRQPAVVLERDTSGYAALTQKPGALLAAIPRPGKPLDPVSPADGLAAWNATVEGDEARGFSVGAATSANALMIVGATPVPMGDPADQPPDGKVPSSIRFRVALRGLEQGRMAAAMAGEPGRPQLISKYDETLFAAFDSQADAGTLAIGQGDMLYLSTASTGTRAIAGSSIATENQFVVPTLIDVVSWQSRPGDLSRTVFQSSAVHGTSNVVWEAGPPSGVTLRAPRARAGTQEAFELSRTRVTNDRLNPAFQLEQFAIAHAIRRTDTPVVGQCDPYMALASSSRVARSWTTQREAQDDHAEIWGVQSDDPPKTSYPFSYDLFVLAHHAHPFTSDKVNGPWVLPCFASSWPQGEVSAAPQSEIIWIGGVDESETSSSLERALARAIPTAKDEWKPLDSTNPQGILRWGPNAMAFGAATRLWSRTVEANPNDRKLGWLALVNVVRTGDKYVATTRSAAYLFTIDRDAAVRADMWTLSLVSDANAQSGNHGRLVPIGLGSFDDSSFSRATPRWSTGETQVGWRRHMSLFTLESNPSLPDAPRTDYVFATGPAGEFLTARTP